MSTYDFWVGYVKIQICEMAHLLWSLCRTKSILVHYLFITSILLFSGVSSDVIFRDIWSLDIYGYGPVSNYNLDMYFWFPVKN